jgi:hypothetical protein
MTILDLGAKQAEMFSKDHLVYAELLVTANAPRLILSYCYSALCRLGKIPPIEGLLLEQKYVLWETAKEFSKGRLSETEGVQLVKSLYALEYYLNL